MENVGIINLSRATEAEIEALDNIENVGIIIVPKAFMGKLTQRVMENVGILVPYVEGMRVYGGASTIDAATLEAMDEPIEILNTGKLSFKGDVTPELVKAKIKSVTNYGMVAVPAKAFGAVMAKVLENYGKVINSDEEKDNGCRGHRHDE